MTFITCNILSKKILKGKKTSFILELPDYRKIRIGKIILTSLLDRTIFVLGSSEKGYFQALSSHCKASQSAHQHECRGI